MQGWVSPLLNIRFEPKKDDLTIMGPDGEEFLTPLEKALRDKAKIQSERKRSEKLAAKLREMGIDPDQI